MRQAQVTSILLAVYDMMHKNQRVVFDLDGSTITNKISGEITEIEWEGREPLIWLEVLEPIDEDLDIPSLCTVDDNPSDLLDTANSSTDVDVVSRQKSTGSSSMQVDQSFHRPAVRP